MGILDFIRRAQQAQQENPQKHDVQLELTAPPAPGWPWLRWASDDEIEEHTWDEVEAMWEDYWLDPDAYWNEKRN